MSDMKFVVRVDFVVDAGHTDPHVAEAMVNHFLSIVKLGTTSAI